MDRKEHRNRDVCRNAEVSFPSDGPRLTRPTAGQAVGFVERPAGARVVDDRDQTENWPSRAGTPVAGAAQAVRAWDFDVTGEASGLEGEQVCEPQPPRIFLLDDDPIFCKLMEKVAKRNGIPLAICSSLEEFGRRRSHHEFDVAVIDYYLEDLKGTDVVCLLEDRPVVLVSRNESCINEDAQWPEAIKKFVPKRQGPQAILEAALTLSRPSTV